MISGKFFFRNYKEIVYECSRNYRQLALPCAPAWNVDDVKKPQAAPVGEYATAQPIVQHLQTQI